MPLFRSANTPFHFNRRLRSVDKPHTTIVAFNLYQRTAALWNIRLSPVVDGLPWQSLLGAEDCPTTLTIMGT